MESRVSFMAFANLCEHLSHLKKQATKKDRLSEYLSEWRREDPNTIFSFLRLLLPHLDRERESFGLKESKLADLYVNALAISKDSHDAFLLKNWEQTGHKDFSDALFKVLRGRLGEDVDEAQPQKKKKRTDGWSLGQVNKFLDELSAGSEERRDKFLKITSSMTALEQKWLTRIILKSMRLGISDVQVLHLIHLEAAEMFNVSMDLKEICSHFASASSASKSFGIRLFKPFKPMLAEREVIEQVPTVIKVKNFVIEPKLDGERIQLHFNAESKKFQYWSRRGTEYTYLYGSGDQGIGSLTPKIVDCFAANVKSAIFDGEMVVFDDKLGKHLPFGTLKNVASSVTESSAHPCFVVFDLVYLNGESLLERPLEERFSLLQQAITNPLPGYFEIIEQQRNCCSVDDIYAALDRVILNQMEGVVIKSLQSRYSPGKRTLDWIKIKPEYVEGLCDDMDVLIIGAWYSSIHTQISAGKPSTFLCGVWDGPDRLLTFCKVGTGYNLEEYRHLLNTNNLELHLIAYKRCPEFLIFPDSGPFDKPDLIIDDPRNSVVIQVKGSQLVPSSSFRSGYTLRHPRFVRQRLDRSPESSMNFNELLRLVKVTSGTLAQRQRLQSKASNVTTTVKKPRRLGKMAQAIASAQARPQLLKEAQRKSRFLASKEFLVLYGDEDTEGETSPVSLDDLNLNVDSSPSLSKLQLEQLIIEAGGRVTQSAQTDFASSLIVISGKTGGIRINNLKSQKVFDILTVSWLKRCLQGRRFFWPPEAKDVVFGSERLQRELRDRVDEYNDKYDELFTDPQQVKQLLERIEIGGDLREKVRMVEEAKKKY